MEKSSRAKTMPETDLARLSLKVFLINLDRAVDRMSHMREMLDRLGIPFERVAAVEGRAIVLPIREFDEIGYRVLHGRKPNPAEIGCYLSHIECARRFLETENAFSLILEDDLKLPFDLINILEGAIRAESDWDILRLSTVSSGRKYAFRALDGHRCLAIALTREKGSGAYLINRAAARWFLNALLPMRLPFDLAFDLEFLAGLKSAFVYPLPISQDLHVPSQIQGNRGSFHLSRWRYASVLPFRAGLEIARALMRTSRLCFLRLRLVATFAQARRSLALFCRKNRRKTNAR